MDADSQDLISQVNTYRKDYLGTAASDLTNIKSVTYNHTDGRLSGEEVSDYTQNYNSDKEVVTSSVNYYLVSGNLVRASDADSQDLISQVNTYRKDYLGTSASDLTNIKSVTYNHTDGRLSGEEVSDYTQNYNSDKEVVTSSVNYYLVSGNLVRASDADSQDLISQVNTYRKAIWEHPRLILQT